MRLFLLFIVLTSWASFAQEMSIGLFRTSKLQSIEITAENCRYTVYLDGDSVSVLDSLKTISIKQASGNLKLILTDGTVKNGVYVALKSDSTVNQAILNPKSPSLNKRRYDGDFQIKVGSGGMTVVNKVPISNYLSGVIESEGGAGRNLEYYKVQALMSRTYALKNRTRHRKEGFELCDDVHCQAYLHKVIYDSTICQAVELTANEVLEDSNGKLVNTYFYANCGGQTSDASYVWNQSVDYCVPFRDTFCIHTKQATWTKKVYKDDWLNFLVKKYHFPRNDSIITPLAFNFTQEDRKAFFIHPSFGIPLRDLRTRFNLKSTYFDVHTEGEYVIIEGRGFGHGVGLCQEGAMQMADYGFSYKQIAQFYFEGVKVILLED